MEALTGKSIKCLICRWNRDSNEIRSTLQCLSLRLHPEVFMVKSIGELERNVDNWMQKWWTLQDYSLWRCRRPVGRLVEVIYENNLLQGERWYICKRNDMVKALDAELVSTFRITFDFKQSLKSIWQKMNCENNSGIAKGDLQLNQKLILNLEMDSVKVWTEFNKNWNWILDILNMK